MLLICLGRVRGFTVCCVLELVIWAEQGLLPVKNVDAKNFCSKILPHCHNVEVIRPSTFVEDATGFRILVSSLFMC